MEQKPTSKTRVLFVLTTLDPGGAQRVMLTLLKRLPTHRFEPYLALLDMRGRFLHEIPQELHVYDLKSKRLRRSFWPLLQLIRRLKPDVVFSTMTRLNLLATLMKPFMPSTTRLVVREATLANAILGTGLWRTVKKRLLKSGLSTADAIICLSEFMQKDLQENLDIPKDKMVTIYNPIDFATIRSKAMQPRPFPQNVPGPNIVSVGRLTQPVKGFDRLIAAFPAILKDKPTAHLWILGEGAAEQELKNQARSLGLSDRVHFPGYQDNPYCWLKYADLFVLPSRHEGTSNVLLEAMACDCPVVVLDHPGGSREIMDLCGQPARIVTDLHVWDSAWFLQPNDQVKKRLHRHFEVEDIVEQYCAVFEGDLPSQERKAA